MTRILTIFDKTPFWAMILAYPAAVAASLIFSVIAFFFPILPFCELFDVEFSNLGPIATFFWGLFFVVFVLTPLFLMVFSLKIGRILYLKHAAVRHRQGT